MCLGFLFYNLCTKHKEGLFLSTVIFDGPLLSALKEDVNCLSRASQLSSDAVMRWILDKQYTVSIFEAVVSGKALFLVKYGGLGLS